MSLFQFQTKTKNDIDSLTSLFENKFSITANAFAPNFGDTKIRPRGMDGIGNKIIGYHQMTPDDRAFTQKIIC